MTDTDGLLRDAGGARPASDVDALIDEPNADYFKWDADWGLRACDALVQLRDSEALARGKIAEQMIEIARLTKLETECWSNPEAWMKWCDVRVLERVERAETEVLILRNDLATYAERIADLEAERADLIKINNGWAHEWDKMREERDALREPTEAMIVAGVKTLLTGHDSQRHYVAALWRRMFDAAIDAAREQK